MERFQGGTNIQESVRSGTPLLPKGPGSHTYIYGGGALERMGSGQRVKLLAKLEKIVHKK